MKKIALQEERKDIQNKGEMAKYMQTLHQQISESEDKREKDREANIQIINQFKEQNFQIKKQLDASEKQV